MVETQPGGEPITVTIAAARRMTGLGVSTLYRGFRSGKLRKVKVGRTTLIPVDSLREFVGVARAEEARS
jgi:excisionase family DNA binding protein